MCGAVKCSDGLVRGNTMDARQTLPEFQAKEYHVWTSTGTGALRNSAQERSREGYQVTFTVRSICQPAN